MLIDHSDSANYRPISLTCVYSKVMEHIFHSHVMTNQDKHIIWPTTIKGLEREDFGKQAH